MSSGKQSCYSYFMGVLKINVLLNSLQPRMEKMLFIEIKLLDASSGEPCAALAQLQVCGGADMYHHSAAEETLRAVTPRPRREMDFGHVLLTGLSWSHRNPAGP